MHPQQLLEDSAHHKTENYAPSPRLEVHGMLARAPRRVFDLGCARGDVGAGLKQRFGNDVFVWGVETNAHSAGIAATRLDRVTGTVLEAMPPEELAQLRDFDTFMLLDVLEHTANPWKLLHTLAQHARADAQFIISLPNARHYTLQADLAAGYWHYKNQGLLDITHLRFFTPYEMRALILQAGLGIDAMTYIHALMLDLGKPWDQLDYPFWLDLDSIKLKIRDAVQLHEIMSVQMLFRASVKSDAKLDDASRQLRHGAHPATLAP